MTADPRPPAPLDAEGEDVQAVPLRWKLTGIGMYGADVEVVSAEAYDKLKGAYQGLLDALKRRYEAAEAHRLATAESSLASVTAERDRAVELLHWYVEANLVDAGDEFGAWDDDVREFITALAATTAATPRDEP